jgi:hypothetical protein
LVRGVDRLGRQYLTGSIREAKCTRLGYRTRLSRLLTLDPLTISCSKGLPFSST